MTKAEELKERIAELTLLHKQEKDDLKKHLHEVRESLKPANILKRGVKAIAESPGIKTKLIGILLGLATGYVAKKVVIGKNGSPLKKVAGNLIQMGLAGTISQNADNLRSLGGDLLRRIFKRKQKRKNDWPNAETKQHNPLKSI